MKANLVFENVTAYNMEKADIRLGEKYRIELEDEGSAPYWFADNDPVLFMEVDEDRRGCTVTAREKGLCTIQLQKSIGVVAKMLYISIFDNVAVRLNPVASTPELKGS